MFKFKIYLYFALFLLGGLLMSERAEAACTASVTPLNFGEINSVTTTGHVDFTATVTYSCSGLINLLSRLYVCIEIAPGSGGTGLTPRTLTHNSSPTEKLTFNIYKDPGRQNIWGYQYTGNETALVIDRGVIVLGLGTVITGSHQIYGRIFSSNPFMLREIGLYRSDMDVTVKIALLGLLGLTSCIDIAMTGNTTLHATTELISACTVTATPLNFGSHPSNFSSFVQSTSGINTTCSKGTIYQIGLNNGLHASDNTRRMKAADDSYVNYELYKDSGHSLRWGAVNTIEEIETTATGQSQQATVYGQVQPQPGLKAATYEDTITVIVTY